MKKDRTSYIMKYVKKNKIGFLLIVLLVLLQNVFSLINPIIYMKIIDDALGRANVQMFYLFVILLIGSNIASSITSFLRSYLITTVEEKIAKDIRNDINSKVSRLTYMAYEKMSFGELSSIYTKAVNYIKEHITYTFIDVGIQTLKLIVIIVIMLRLNLLITLVSVVVLGLYMFNYRYWGKRVEATAKKDIDMNSRILKKIEENYKNVLVTKLYNAYNYVEKAHSNVYQDYMKNTIKLNEQYNLNVTISTIVLFLSTGTVWFIGGRSVLAGEMTIGEITALISYQTMLINPIRSYSNFSNSKSRFNSSYNKINDILDATNESVDGLELKEGINHIEFNNVSFSYHANESILKNVNFSLYKNTVNALVGLSGSGKTTVAKILLGLYTPSSGSVLLNNHNFYLLSLGYIRDQITLINQNSVFYNDTIDNNLKISGCNLVNFDELSKILDLEDIYSNHPNGQFEYLENCGENLSGGEKKRIDLARGLMRSSSVIIFDESTSSLDKVRRDKFMKYVHSFKKDKIILWITHNLEELIVADKVLGFENGELSDLSSCDSEHALSTLARKYIG